MPQINQEQFILIYNRDIFNIWNKSSKITCCNWRIVIPVVSIGVFLFYGVSTLFGLFNTEFSHLGLVWFYDISTIVGYLMPNPFLYI